MRERLVELLEKLDLTLATAHGLVSEAALDPIASLVKVTRSRLDYPEDMVIVALSGGTGSGKSSILNAVAGDELVDVGGVRPTTSSPLAVAGPDRIGAVVGYLRELGIGVHSAQGFPRWQVMVDMPDTDSVVVDHRHQVEALLPSIDVVVWVADPEKYRDETFHSLIRSAAEYGEQMVFVLNQVDRLAVEAREEVMADFRASLVDDGVDRPNMLATAANPRSGPPIGVGDLLDVLHELAADPLLLRSKLLADITRAASALAGLVGDRDAGFEVRADAVLTEMSALILHGQSDSATTVATEFVAAYQADSEGAVEELQASVPGLVQDAGAKLDAALDRHKADRPRIRWSTRRDELPETERLSIVRDSLSADLVDPVRELVRRRARFAAVVADLSLTVTSVTSS